MLCGVTVIVEADAAVAGRLAALGPGAVVLADVDALRRYLDVRGSESVVILGPSVEMPSAARLARWARAAHPDLGVIVARRGCTATELWEALLAGVREVVDDRDHAALITAVRRARAVSRAMRSEQEGAGRVVTVFSAREAAGTTSLAINLAASLAQGGKRRVCLVDATPGSADDVGTALGLTPGPGLGPAVSSDAPLGVADVAAMVTPYAPGLGILLAAIPAKLIECVLRLLRDAFDHVVVHTSRGFDDHVLAALDGTDVLLLPAPWTSRR